MNTKETTQALQKNKEMKQVVLYTTNLLRQDAYIQQAKAKGYVVVKGNTGRSAFINSMK